LKFILFFSFFPVKGTGAELSAGGVCLKTLFDTGGYRNMDGLERIFKTLDRFP
jgi:hypothetical protein